MWVFMHGDVDTSPTHAPPARRFPAWDVATSTGSTPYDGQFAYAYAKRGQVLLCERWSQAHPKVQAVHMWEDMAVQGSTQVHGQYAARQASRVQLCERWW